MSTTQEGGAGEGDGGSWEIVHPAWHLAHTTAKRVAMRCPHCAQKGKVRYLWRCSRCHQCLCPMSISDEYVIDGER
eukprot:866627-Prymnesium_polylepis.2